MYNLISFLAEMYVTLYCAWVWFNLSAYNDGDKTDDAKDKLITKLLTPWAYLGTVKDRVTRFFKSKD